MKLYLLLAEDFPVNATGYPMTAEELRAWAEERVSDHLGRLGGGALDLGEASIARAVSSRGWRLWKVLEAVSAKIMEMPAEEFDR